MTTTSRILSLDGTWQLAFGPQAGRAADMARPEIPADWPVIPARVPGNVELDLMAAGQLPGNLEQGNRIYEAQRYEAHQWWYRREFAAPELKPGQRLFLTFAGLDTLGTVWLNGHKLGSTANMLVEQRFDITDAVRAGGTNDLTGLCGRWTYIVDHLAPEIDRKRFPGLQEFVQALVRGIPSCVDHPCEKDAIAHTEFLNDTIRHRRCNSDRFRHECSSR